MNYAPDRLTQETRKLPPIPQAAQKALVLVREPEANAATIGARLIAFHHEPRAARSHPALVAVVHVAECFGTIDRSEETI